MVLRKCINKKVKHWTNAFKSTCQNCNIVLHINGWKLFSNLWLICDFFIHNTFCHICFVTAVSRKTKIGFYWVWSSLWLVDCAFCNLQLCLCLNVDVNPLTTNVPHHRNQSIDLQCSWLVSIYGEHWSLMC